MSKAVLISIRPKWCELIANGTKTVEVRKSRPKLHTPFKCCIYCTSYKHLAFAQDAAGANPIACIDAETAIPVGGFVGNAKVIGEFICDRIYELAPLNHAPSDVEQQACLTREEIVQYLNGIGYGWHISDLRIYDTPRELSTLRRPYECDECDAKWATDCNDCHDKGKIKRPPQSWRYVEELNDG